MKGAPDCTHKFEGGVKCLCHRSRWDYYTSSSYDVNILTTLFVVIYAIKNAAFSALYPFFVADLSWQYELAADAKMLASMTLIHIAINRLFSARFRVVSIPRILFDAYLAFRVLRWILFFVLREVIDHYFGNLPCCNEDVLLHNAASLTSFLLTAVLFSSVFYIERAIALGINTVSFVKMLIRIVRENLPLIKNALLEPSAKKPEQPPVDPKTD
jgi:hypothetical protein